MREIKKCVCLGRNDGKRCRVGDELAGGLDPDPDTVKAKASQMHLIAAMLVGTRQEITQVRLQAEQTEQARLGQAAEQAEQMHLRAAQSSE